jgi:hypothetical protein
VGDRDAEKVATACHHRAGADEDECESADELCNRPAEVFPFHGEEARSRAGRNWADHVVRVSASNGRVELDEPSLPHGEPYRPLGRRAQIVTILLIIGIGTTIVGVVSGLMERSLLDDVQQGQFITPTQADDNDRRQLLVAVVDGTVFIATGVFFLFWFHRVYRNLPALGGDRRYGTGWAIGSWFVPFLNVWRPKQIVNDIWRESGPHTTDEYGTKDERNNVPNLFLLWWLAWLLMGALYWIATRTSWSAVTIDELLAANALSPTRSNR